MNFGKQLVIGFCVFFLPIAVNADPIFPDGDHDGEDHSGENHSGEFLEGAFLTNTNLSNSDFSDTEMNWVKVQGADLRGTDFRRADFTDIWDLGGALIDIHTNFFDASLQGSIFEGQDMRNLSMADALSLPSYMNGSNLSGLDLRKPLGNAGIVDLNNAVLVGTVFRGISINPDLQKHLENVDARYADFSTCWQAATTDT